MTSNSGFPELNLLKDSSETQMSIFYLFKSEK